MTTIDDGLPAATQRVNTFLSTYTAPTNPGSARDEFAEAVARAAREDVAETVRQAKAEAVRECASSLLAGTADLVETGHLFHIPDLVSDMRGYADQIEADDA